jgi:hypothetical protein
VPTVDFIFKSRPTSLLLANMKARFFKIIFIEFDVVDKSLFQANIKNENVGLSF